MFKNNLKIIFAATSEGYFSGPNNTLPWDPKKVPTDLSIFKYKTLINSGIRKVLIIYNLFPISIISINSFGFTFYLSFISHLR